MNFFVLLCLFINASLIKRTLADNDPSLQVRAKDGSRTYCFLLPNSPMTIADSEDGTGKTVSYCTKPTSDQQQSWPDNAWKNGGPNVAEKRDQWGNLLYRQITGCIDTSKFNTLLSNDGEGQYDSNGGQNHQGNPVGSSCYRFERFVQLVEPDVGRICLRCCNGEGHCDLSHDEDGCTIAIPGDYTGCE